MFLWPDPADRSAPDVIRHRARWSADFPHPPCGGRNHLADLGFHDTIWGSFLIGEGKNSPRIVCNKGITGKKMSNRLDKLNTFP